MSPDSGLRPSHMPLCVLANVSNQNLKDMEESDKYISYRAYVDFLRRMAVLLTDRDKIERVVRNRIRLHNPENKPAKL